MEWDMLEHTFSAPPRSIRTSFAKTLGVSTELGTVADIVYLVAPVKWRGSIPFRLAERLSFPAPAVRLFIQIEFRRATAAVHCNGRLLEFGWRGNRLRFGSR